MKSFLRVLPAALLLALPGCSPPGGFEWIIIAFVVLLFFGGSKLPGLMRSMGAGMHEFKKGLKEGEKAEAEDDKASQAKELKSGRD